MPVYGADMLAHNRGSGRGDSGGFLHIRIGHDTPSDKSGQGATLQSRIKSGRITGAALNDGSGIKPGSSASWRCSASMARSPLNLGLNFPELISAAARVRARDRGGGSATGRMRSRAQGDA
jgi:hypothetical protein